MDFKRAIALNSDFSATYNNLGNAYRDINQLDKAIENYNLAIKIDDNDQLFYRNRGQAYRVLENFEQAVDDFTKAIDLSAENDDRALNYYLRGMTRREQGNYLLALSDYENATKYASNQAERDDIQQRIREVKALMITSTPIQNGSLFD